MILDTLEFAFINTAPRQPRLRVKDWTKWKMPSAARAHMQCEWNPAAFLRTPFLQG